MNSEFDDLISLDGLNLSCNEFKTFPEDITKLKSLKKLDLGNNQLSSLPESILNLNNLLSLRLSKNPLVIRADMITKSILKHFRERDVYINLKDQ